MCPLHKLYFLIIHRHNIWGEWGNNYKHIHQNSFPWKQFPDHQCSRSRQLLQKDIYLLKIHLYNNMSFL